MKMHCRIMLVTTQLVVVQMPNEMGGTAADMHIFQNGVNTKQAKFCSILKSDLQDLLLKRVFLLQIMLHQNKKM